MILEPSITAIFFSSCFYRSGSKVMEKGRASPAIEILQQHLNDAQSQESGNDDK